MPSFVFCCFGVIVMIALIYVPILIIRKGFDLFIGCFGNIFVVTIAAILLIAYITIAEVDICHIWLLGETLCSIKTSF